MNAYASAIEAQDAVNLAAIVHTLDRLLREEIGPEVRAAGGGTDEICSHPVVIMFVNQLLYLTTHEVVDLTLFGPAFRACHRLAVWEKEAAAAADRQDGNQA